MGVKDLFNVIRKECPSAIHPAKFGVVRNITVAIDFSIFINLYVKGSEDWKIKLINLLVQFKKLNILPIFIFDGPNFPFEKKQEQEKRRDEVNKRDSKLERGKELLPIVEEYRDAKELPPEKMIAELKDIIGPVRAKNMGTEWDNIFSIYPCLVEALGKIEKQSQKVLPEYIPIARDFIEAFGYTHYTADGEAEGLCAAMCIEGRVDAVVSNDSDVLAYGCPYLISKWNEGGSCEIVVLEEVLKIMNITYESFRDMCIMLSCDYNNRIKGWPPDGKKRKAAASLGAVAVVSFFKNSYTSIEEMEADGLLEDPDVIDGTIDDPDAEKKGLNYQRVRELFIPPDTDFLPDPKPRNIDRNRLMKLWKKHKIKISYEKAMMLWDPPEIVFHTDLEED